MDIEIDPLKEDLALSRERDRFYQGYAAGIRNALPGEDEIRDFLSYYTTPDGLVSTRLDSFVVNLSQWLETWSDD